MAPARAAVVLFAGAAMLVAAGTAAAATPPALCAASASGLAPLLDDAPEYYQIELVPTGRVPGTRFAEGVAEVTHDSGPFTIGVTPDGRYAQRLRIRIAGLEPRADGVFAVWVTTPDLDRVEPVGLQAGSGETEVEIGWNKFLVVVSLEAAGEPQRERWRGPIVLRGSSRSGRMHTMAGHGPFQGEPCAKYGY